MSGHAISVEGVTKTYRVGIGRARLREMVPPPVDRGGAKLFPKWWAKNTFDAVEDVSFSVEAGSSVGMVGHNGAGKTTLLKVIAGVTAPARGRVAVRGRIAALIDLLVGFHPDLTGRENAYLLGALHGYTRRQMAPRIERLLEFSELEDLVDTPIKRYSAGMAARLGFSVITVLDAEILLVDEVLTVGDASFQRKCIEWIDSFRKAGGTLLFVSHSLALLRNMTSRVLWLDQGQLIEDGPTAEVLAMYANASERRDFTPGFGRKRASRRLARSQGLNRWGAGGVRIQEVRWDGETLKQDLLEISVDYQTEELEQARFCLAFVDESGREVAVSASPTVPLDREGTVRCEIQPMPLRSGVYYPLMAIIGPDGLVHDRWKLDRALVVEHEGDLPQIDDLGPVRIHGEWANGHPLTPSNGRGATQETDG